MTKNVVEQNDQKCSGAKNVVEQKYDHQAKIL
jgi:hypothetical protein